MIPLTLAACVVLGVAGAALRAQNGAVASVPAPAPAGRPAPAYYHPDRPGLTATLADYLAWYRARPGRGHRYDPSRLTVGVFVHASIHEKRNMGAFDALVRAVERRGHNVVTLVALSNVDVARALSTDGQPVVDVFLFSSELLDLGDRGAGLAMADRLGVPILGAFHMHDTTPDQYAARPMGFHPALTYVVSEAEREGRIEPLVISGKGTSADGRIIQQPMLEQIEWRADRALSWARLHRAPNREKRVVFTYWSEGAGKANVGGDPDDFLDVPGSLVRLMAEMKAAGYDTGTAPVPDRDALVRRMAREASNVGSWAPAELARRVRESEVALIPEAKYRAWFNRLPKANRDAIVEMWGPPPGQVMVHTDSTGQRVLVIPKIQFGNVLIAPHPDWGYLQSNKALMSVGALPPHHQYLAFFLWLQEEWKADAWVSLFSNIVLQPGKNEGPMASDQIGILLGRLPHVHPERLGANGGLSNKRKGLAQTTGWFNLVAPSDTSAETGELRAQLGRYATQADATWKAGAEPAIRAEMERSGVARAIGLDATSADFETLRTEAATYLNALDRSLAPHGSRVLGEVPEPGVLADMVTGMLGPELRDAVEKVAPDALTASRRLVRQVLVDGRTPADAVTRELGREVDAVARVLADASAYADRLRAAPREISGILATLSGRWIEPGPMDEPMRDPTAVPPGRSLYSFNQALMPTREAEGIGVKMAEALVADHRSRHDGAYPVQQAFVVWSSDIVKNHGVTEAQMLHLLGTRVVRNARGEVTGVTLIPRAELGRPRVDVLASISGVYRDHFQDKVELITEATRLAAASPESDNPVAAAVREAEVRLRAEGESTERAAVLARARVFSTAPGAYSPSIQFLAKSGDQRGDERRMADLFTNRMSHAYGAGLYGAPARSAFQSSLARTDGATLPRTNSVNGMLDNPMPAGFLGGLNLAARTVTGRNLDLYVTNLRDLSRPELETASRTLQVELRTRYLNEGWLREMQQHGYDGARNFMFLTDHLDLWDTTASQMVSTEDWSEVKQVFVDDRFKLGMDAYFDQHNPHAQQVVLANLLGAAKRGQWEASAADLAQVAGRLAKSAGDHGAVCEATICRNPELTAYVEKAVAGEPGGAALVAQYRQAIANAVSATGPDAAPGMSTVAPAVSAPAPAPAPAPVAMAPSAPPAPPASAAAPQKAPASEAPPTVEGRVLEAAETPVQRSQPGEPAWHLRVVASLAVALFLAGWGWPMRRNLRVTRQ
jgi:cobaltochelatase CobN